MKILAQQASVKVAAVEIKALTISGKQVTLAVFRQLEEEEIIIWRDGKYVLAGEPWGRINYHPDKCIEHRHFHIIWQKGEELRRGRVELKYTDRDGREMIKDDASTVESLKALIKRNTEFLKWDTNKEAAIAKIEKSKAELIEAEQELTQLREETQHAENSYREQAAYLSTIEHLFIAV